MKVFISWSGEPSKTIALALREWISNVLQHAEVWVSGRDISAGTDWARELDIALEEINFGIVCLTHGNLTKPWILYEAGALSKLDESRVCTYLYNLEPSVVERPLGKFQANTVSRDGTWEIIKSINEFSEDAKLDNEKLSAAFDMWYSKLEEELSDLPEETDVEILERQPLDMIPELLDTTREISKKVELLEQRLIPPKFPLAPPGRLLPPGLPFPTDARRGLNLNNLQQYHDSPLTLNDLLQLLPPSGNPPLQPTHIPPPQTQDKSEET